MTESSIFNGSILLPDYVSDSIESEINVLQMIETDYDSDFGYEEHKFILNNDELDTRGIFGCDEKYNYRNRDYSWVEELIEEIKKKIEEKGQQFDFEMIPDEENDEYNIDRYTFILNGDKLNTEASYGCEQKYNYRTNNYIWIEELLNEIMEKIGYRFEC